MPVVCTEAGRWHADVLGLSDKMVVEVEVKKSRSDLQAEFRNKQTKHFTYSKGATNSASYVPNYFYFYVPEALGAYAAELTQETFPKAGIAVQLDTEYLDGRNTQVIRKPQRLHAEPPRPSFVRTAIQRMSSELCGRYIALDTYYDRIKDTMLSAEKSAVDAAIRAAGALDSEDLPADLVIRARELKLCVEGTDIFSSSEDEQKWKVAAIKWLEGQYLHSEEWRNASQRL